MSAMEAAEIPVAGINVGRLEGLRKPNGKIDNEYQNLRTPVLRPLASVSIEKKNGDKTEVINFDKELNDEFSYFSRTRDIETGTERANILQRIADKMTEGTGVKARVVIMNKGEETEAFVMPEGTIFISQSCINAVDSLDEIGGILAHEIRHVVQKSFQKGHEAKGYFLKFSVGWLHEAASDLMTSQLLEKAGLSSLGFSSAIEKISGSSRGVIHQSGLMRASQGVAGHLAVDYKTSSQAETVIPEILKRPVRPTNLEMVEKAIKTSNVQELRELLPNLHPEDLKTTIFSAQEKLKGQKSDESLYLLIKRPEPKQMVVSCYDLISSRLERAGYNDDEICLFLLSLPIHIDTRRIHESFLPIVKEKLIPHPERLLELVKSSKDFDDNYKLDEMNKLVFDEKNRGDLIRIILPEYLKELVDYTEMPDANGVPVTKEILFECLSELKSLQDTRILLIYLEKVFVSRAKEGEIDEEQIRDFFEQAKEMGISLDFIQARWWLGGGELTRNGDTVLRVLKEAAGLKEEEKKELDFEKTIKETFCLVRDHNYRFNLLSEDFVYGRYLFFKLKEYFLEKKFNGEEMEAHLLQISELIDNFDIGPTGDWFHFLSTGNLIGFNEESTLSEEKVSINEKVAKLNLKMLVGVCFFEKDTPDFYSYMTRIMNESKLISFLSRKELGILLGNFLQIIDYPRAEKRVCFSGNGVEATNLEVSDFDRFGELPMVREYIKGEDKEEIPDFDKLFEYTQKVFGEEAIDIYSDDLKAVILGREVREKFLFLLQNKITPDQYPALLKFVDHYFSQSTLKENVLREIHERYLLSDEISLENKTEYLVINFESVGPEGMAIVAEGIHTLDEYKVFRQKMGKRLEEFLDGSSATVKKVALGDFLSSFFARKYSYLFNTCSSSPEIRRSQSTDLAHAWFSYVTHTDFSGEKSFSYLREEGKFVVDSQERDQFKSYHDFVEYMRNQGSLSRLGLAMKALVDSGGALTTKKDRKILGRMLTSSLGYPNSFVGATLRSACEVADAKYVGFPVASMLGPLLFSSYDPKEVDIEKLSKERVQTRKKVDGYLRWSKEPIESFFTKEEMERLIGSTTQELVFYGYKYKDSPKSAIAGLVQVTYRQGNLATEALERFISGREHETEETEEKKPEINPSTEAVIKGVEATGALGVRSLQLARQLYQFSPELDRRLSSTLDANKGLNKLFFWENLAKLAEQDEAIGDFVKNRLIRVDGYLGGGSLFTTYAAVVKGEQGEKEQIVLKMLNPNAQAFIDNVYKIAKDSLSLVARRTIGESRRQAKMGQVLIGLSREWCTKDINDQNFLEDDQVFRKTIAAFNENEGAETIYAPELEFNSVKLKVEDQAEGVTANKLLDSTETDSAIKQRVCEQIGKLFAFQLAHPTERGDFLIHADPHIGNYIIEVIDSQPRVGVIDRSMYLRLDQEDVRVIRVLVEGDNQEFLDSLINRVLDVNKVKGVSRGRILVSTKLAAASEYARQIGKKPDKFSLLNSVLSKLVEEKMEVPLELRLMIKNIGSVKELLARHGVSFDRVFAL